MKRTKELFMRWTEFAAFSPLMRTHEGNRPLENWQFDSDVETIAHLGRMTRVHVALKEYLKACVKENSKSGMPVMRPLFLSFPEDQNAYTIDDQYLLGPDLLIAPVIAEGSRARKVHFPGSTWLNFWTGEEAWASTLSGVSEIGAPLGEPPVFIRAQSSWIRTFVAARNAANN
jgi:alpha-glucosidase